MDTTWTPQRFLHALKGAPLVCLLGLRWLRRPVGVLELAECTGYERDTVARGLRVLEVWGFAETPGGYGQWRLTAAVQQLPLFTADELAGAGVTAELAEKTRQFAGSSSSLTINSLDEVKVKPLPLLRGDLAEKTRQFSEECCRLAELLVLRLACGRQRAQAAVAVALEEHRLSPEEVEIEIIYWARYCATAKGLHNPGAFVAAKLSRNEPCPDVDLGNYSEDYWRVQALRRQGAGVREQESGVRDQDSGVRDQDSEGEGDDA